MSGGFVKRRIDVSFRLGSGATYDTTQSNTALSSGLRVSATINKAGSVGMPTLIAKIFGLQPSIVKGISTLGNVYGAALNNQVTLSAGDDQSGMGVVFTGVIDSAWADFQEPANPTLSVRAHTGLLESLRPLPPTSFNGSADVATIISSIAKQMGWDFDNSGVSVQIRNAYLSGTGREQAYKAADMANIRIMMDTMPSGSNVIAIWPQGGLRDGVAPFISPQSGMVMAPAWEDNALVVKTLFNPSVSTGEIGTSGVLVGSSINVESSVPNATGSWQVFGIQHELVTETPEGAWFTTIHCNNIGWPNNQQQPRIEQ